MITVTIIKKTEVEVKMLSVDAGVRYWEDATVNGVADTSGDLIPCRKGDAWMPTIDLETGIITNWEQGKAASIHYKVCDAGVYTLTDEQGNTVQEISGYVPKIMCPGGSGYGDYIIMNIDATGRIDKWSVLLDEFDDDSDD